MMSKGKKPPERSKIERAKPLAYQRRASDDARVVSEETKAPVEEKTEERTTGEMTAVKPSEADAPEMPEAAAADAATKADKAAEAKAADAKAADAKPPADAKPAAEAKPTAETKAAAKVDVKPDPVEPEPVRAARPTMSMPVAVVVGAPPEVPGDVENPTHMPGPGNVPSGVPTDPALAPGRVPSGDSRSLRRGADFALIYRQGSAVITRFGAIGTRGQWRVVEYPTPTSASNAYAKECSRFVGEGFSDYRD